MQYKLTKNFTERYEAFLRSDVFKDVNEHSKSDYWKYQSARVKVEVSENNVTTTGESGFYTSSSNNLKEIKRKVFSVMKSPSKLTEWLRIKIGLSSDGIKLLSYFDAFEKVMSRHPVTDPVFIRLEKIKNIL